MLHNFSFNPAGYFQTKSWIQVKFGWKIALNSLSRSVFPPSKWRIIIRISKTYSHEFEFVHIVNWVFPFPNPPPLRRSIKCRDATQSVLLNNPENLRKTWKSTSIWAKTHTEQQNRSKLDKTAEFFDWSERENLPIKSEIRIKPDK